MVTCLSGAWIDMGDTNHHPNEILSARDRDPFAFVGEAVGPVMRLYADPPTEDSILPKQPTRDIGFRVVAQ